MDKITLAVLCRRMSELEQRVEEARQLILKAMGDEAADAVASKAFYEAVAALRGS